MYRMRDIARKGLAPPVLLLLCLLINIWARWPILMHIDEVFTIHSQSIHMRQVPPGA